MVQKMINPQKEDNMLDTAVKNESKKETPHWNY